MARYANPAEVDKPGLHFLVEAKVIIVYFCLSERRAGICKFCTTICKRMTGVK